MTTGVACPVPILTFFLPNGELNSGGYVAPTVGGVPTAVYQDSGLTTPLPLVSIPNQSVTGFQLNSYGQPASSSGASQQVFLPSSTVYEFTIYDQYGNQLNQATYVAGPQTETITTGTFTPDWLGFSAAPTGVCNWQLAGNLVTLFIPLSNTGTSNTDGMAITNIPAEIMPSTSGTNARAPCYVIDNGAEALGGIDFTGESSMVFFKGSAAPSSTGFTASGTKGLPYGWTVSYWLG